MHTDIYALGVTAYRLVNGDAFLPDINDAGELQDAIIRGDYPDRNLHRPYVPSKLRRIINKCMSLAPEDRYQSASAFRQQLEALEIKCDWTWKRKNRILRYRAICGSIRVNVAVRELPKKRFSIETTKTSINGTTRRVTKDCHSSLTLRLLKTTLRKLLCRYVTDGK